MNEFKGTPGPWTVERHSGEEYGPKENCSFAIIGPSLDEESPGLQLATVISDCLEGHKANASLIAAAPDLLEALQRTLYQPLTGNPPHERLVEFWEYEKTQGRGEADDMLFALAAIKKALGKGEGNDQLGI